MKVLLITGSRSTISKSQVLINYISEKFKKDGHNVVDWNFIDNSLPFYNPNGESEYSKEEMSSISKFKKFILDADIVVFSTPTYHSGPSGLIKNALDHLGHKDLKGKAVALMGHGGGIRGSASACEALRPVIRAIGGYCALIHVSSGSTDFSTDQSGEILLINETVQNRSCDMIQELYELAALLKNHN